MVKTAAKYQAYAEYKDSGVEWVGDIPSTWDVKPVLALFSSLVEKNTDGYVSNVLSLSYGRIVRRDIEDNFGLLPESFNTYQIVKNGDIILRLTDLQNDKRSLRVGLVKEKGIITSAYLKLSVNQHIDPRFAYRLLHSYDTTKVFYGMGGGLRQSMKFEDFKRLPILFPSKDEQTQIANFLDHETAKIDHLIEKQQQLIELLKEKRQTVISYLVNVKEGEASIKLKYAVEILAGYSFSSTGFKTDSNDGVALLRGINVGVGNIKWDECVWWSKSDTEGLERYILKKGDLVFGMDRPWISTGARVAEIQEYDLPSYLVQRVARVRALRGFYQPYIKLILGSKEFKSFIESDLTGVSVPHISTDQIISFPIRKLDFEQQVKLTDQAIEYINKIDFLIVKAESAIQLMQDRRTTLISAAVTGKIDVRNWQAPTVTEADTEFSA